MALGSIGKRCVVLSGRDIDAQYGKPFEDARWNKYFYGDRVSEPGKAPIHFFHPNPGFRPTLYSLADKAFLEVMKVALGKIGAEPATGPVK